MSDYKRIRGIPQVRPIKDAMNNFLDAFHDYQQNAFAIQIALQRMMHETKSLYSPLKAVVLRSNSFISGKITEAQL